MQLVHGLSSSAARREPHEEYHGACQRRLEAHHVAHLGPYYEKACADVSQSALEHRRSTIPHACVCCQIGGDHPAYLAVAIEFVCNRDERSADDRNFEGRKKDTKGQPVERIGTSHQPSSPARMFGKHHQVNGGSYPKPAAQRRQPVRYRLDSVDCMSTSSGTA